ncbi:MAG: hypothetical protein U9P79_03670 [Candidatus Cloacimonadota bacterium]|nr:hypothetical protein [Candidatus Cloacimonadota bacterium]
MKNSNIIKICLLVTVVGAMINLLNNAVSINVLINGLIIFVSTYLLILFAQLIITIISISINQKKGFDVKPKDNSTPKTKKVKKKK